MEFVVKLLFVTVICIAVFHSGYSQDLDFNLPSSFHDFLRMDVNESTSNSILPDILNDTCSLVSDSKETYIFSCEINTNNTGLWNFDHIRRWISASNYKFKFNIKCFDNTEIVLPWPMKGKNIIQIKVNDCFLTGFFSDIGNTLLKTTPDNLQVLDIQHSTILIGLTDLMSFMINFENISEEYNCGNEETLETLIYKNITYAFNEHELNSLRNGSLGTSADDILSSGGNMIANTRSVEYKCKFKRLKRLDESLSASKSRYFLSIQTELSNFPQLQFYNLSNTGQTEISKQFMTWWRFFPNLKTLDLSHNFISTIDLDPSANLWETEDVKLDLTYNNLTELTRDELELISGIPNIFVDIRNNPIDCICSENMLEVLDLIKHEAEWETLQLQRYDYIKHLTCHTPEGLKGRQLIDIDNSDLSCPEYSTSVAPIIILSVTIFILLVVIIVLTKFRKEIFILTYTRFHIILPCQPDDVSENKKYDAFVSYSSNDEEWVSKTFKDLECFSSDSYHQFKFCLHHRDFIPGKTIFDNVIDSVESSRHTVIILSRHFLQSHYCMYEFHEAFQQSIIERKRHMVVVLMENIPEEELPTDLKRCLKTFTYIRKDDSIFTDRLIYAMSHKPRRDSKSNNKNTITGGHENVGFSSDKEVMQPSMLVTPRNRTGNGIITLSQIVPDLVVGHSETKTSDVHLSNV